MCRSGRGTGRVGGGSGTVGRGRAGEAGAPRMAPLPPAAPAAVDSGPSAAARVLGGRAEAVGADRLCGRVENEQRMRGQGLPGMIGSLVGVRPSGGWGGCALVGAARGRVMSRGPGARRCRRGDPAAQQEVHGLAGCSRAAHGGPSPGAGGQPGPLPPEGALPSGCFPVSRCPAGSADTQLPSAVRVPCTRMLSSKYIRAPPLFSLLYCKSTVYYTHTSMC